jgi:hypothetical protein
MEKDTKEKSTETKEVGCLEGGLYFSLVFMILYNPIYQINQAKLEAGTPPGETLDSVFDFMMNIEVLIQDFMVSSVVTLVIMFLVTRWREGKPYGKSKYTLEKHDELKDEILDED